MKLIWRNYRLLVISLLAGLALSACARADHDYFKPSDEKVPLPDGLSAEEVVVETSDGEHLFAWYVPALEGCPTLLMLHGRSGHIGRGVEKYGKVHDAGVGLLALSWRGYAGSTGTPSEAGLFADAEAGYRFLKTKGVANEQIVVHGFSLGTAPATKLASDVELAALILEAPAFSILDLYRERYPKVPATKFAYHAFRTDLFIPSVTEPILMVHGDADTAIPPHHSAELARVAGVAVERVIIPGGTHTSLTANGQYENVIWPFLQTIYPDCTFTRNSEASLE